MCKCFCKFVLSANDDLLMFPNVKVSITFKFLKY